MLQSPLMSLPFPVQKSADTNTQSATDNQGANNTQKPKQLLALLKCTGNVFLTVC